MHCFLLILISLSGTWAASSTLTIYEHFGQSGSSRDLTGAEPRFQDLNWNDKVSSVKAVGGSWELYTNTEFQGSRMVVPSGRSLNAYHNDQYSSGRPICVYANNSDTAKLIVYEHYDLQGAKKEYLDPTDHVESEWNDRISSVYAAKGDWEMYTYSNYEGWRQTVKEGQNINVQINDQITSLRPICETYRKTCQLKRISVIDNGNLEPQYESTEIIGSQDGGSCWGPSSHTLTLSSTDSVEESSTLEISETDEVNWGVSTSVQVEGSSKFLGSGVSVTVGVSVSAGGSHSITTTNSKSFSSGTEKLVGLSIGYTTPGAALVFGSVDRYKIDKSDIPATMHMQCPDGSTFTKRTTIKLKSMTYPSAHFWSMNGTFYKKACAKNWNLTECVRGVRRQYTHTLTNKRNIVAAFKACFANGKGYVG
ncbi:hypothetical protein ACHWQZ_G010042 [Mnemiopsis leidyi]